MKKVISVVLALVLMLSAVSMIAVAEEDCDCTMTIGETRTVPFNGDVHDGFYVVKFVAPGNGKVVIASNGKNYLTCNPVLEVYKDSLSSSGVFMGKYEGNGKTKHDFSYELNCEAGKTYFFAIHNSLSATEVEISIQCLHEVYEDGYCLTCLGECPHIKGDNLVGCCPCGEAFDGEDVVVGKRYLIEADSDYVWFRFDAKERAPYILQSENPDDAGTWSDIVADPAFIIVDETGENVIANDANVSADDKNFNFPFLFTKGERYFIGVKNNKVLADDWYFTFADGTSHTIPEEYEVEEQKVDAEGNLVFEEKKDENGNVVYEEKKDENGNVVYEVEVDADGNPVLDADGNPVKIPVMVPVMIPVMEMVTKVRYIEHELKYVAHTDPTCQNPGHTPSIVCNDCKDAEGNALVIAGGDEIPKVECKDDNGDYKCEWCDNQVGEPPIPEDPTKNCSCNCHKKGISKFFFDFILFFQKIFRLNSVCKCGVRHY